MSKPTETDIHIKNIIFRAERGLNYPMDNKVLLAALKSAVPNKDIMKVLSKGMAEVFRQKQEAEHAED